jgi:hypothetical protein
MVEIRKALTRNGRVESSVRKTHILCRYALKIYIHRVPAGKSYRFVYLTLRNIHANPVPAVLIQRSRQNSRSRTQIENILSF